MTPLDDSPTGDMPDDKQVPDDMGAPANLDEMPGDAREKRRWIQAELAKHRNAEHNRPWTQADIAESVGASEGLVALVFASERRTGAKVVAIQRITARILRVGVGELFGHICKSCPNCGTAHQPKRVMAAAESV